MAVFYSPNLSNESVFNQLIENSMIRDVIIIMGRTKLDTKSSHNLNAFRYRYAGYALTGTMQR